MFPPRVEISSELTSLVLLSFPRLGKKWGSKRAPVAHASNPSYPGGRDRRIAIRSQPRQIVHKTISKNPSQK
jgi:hypothetical protein